MFAFVIYDKAKKRFFMARDRFGEKPLYYTHRRGLFAFASELTALAQHHHVERSTDMRSLQKFFAYGYLPAPNAMLSGARKLPGGHWLSYDIANEAITITPYWRFVIEPDESLTHADEPRLVDECTALLSQAARRRLMSDRSLGVFLSGGLDSSCVLASLTDFLPADLLNAFTIGFTEPTFDESAYARMVARHLGVLHHERVFDLNRARELIVSVLARLDEPLGDASVLPSFMLSAFAQERVTVALTGDGGDELFAGYDPFLALSPAKVYERTVPSWLHRRVRRLVDFLPASSANMSLDFKLRRSLKGLSYPEDVWLPVWMGPLDSKEIGELFDTPIHAEDIYDEAIALWRRDPQKSTVDRALEFFAQFYLQDDVLMKSDRAAMMSSLETRAVFLDNDLVEFSRRLPNRFKFQKGQRKYLLKQVARRLLPATIVDRKKKGFGLPLAKWLRDAPRLFSLSPIAGLRSDFAHAAFAEHCRSGADHRLFIWSWLAVQSFAERVNDIDPSQPARG
jgi:asparagine synthase (glutamine-hydrolysing)